MKKTGNPASKGGPHAVPGPGATGFAAAVAAERPRLQCRPDDPRHRTGPGGGGRDAHPRPSHLALVAGAAGYGRVRRMGIFGAEADLSVG
jgi:hypothetical protein